MVTSKELAEYFVDTYRDPEEPISKSMNGLFGEFLGEQIRMDRDLDPEKILRAANSERDYDWEGLKDDFRIFLEKRLDRYHDGDIENPGVDRPNFEEDAHYALGYVKTSMGEANDAFMTSVIQFKSFESPEIYALELEYLDEEEGVEAIEHLLDKDEEEEVKRMLRKGVSRKDEERVRKAYRKIAKVNPELAREIKEDISDERFEAIMSSELTQVLPAKLESFRDELDF